MQVITVIAWVTAVLIFVILVCGAWIILKAWYDVRRQPKKPMHYCETHGPLTDGQVMTFIDQPYCFRCWSGKVNDAQRNHR